MLVYPSEANRPALAQLDALGIPAAVLRQDAIAQWQLSLKEWEKSTQSEVDSSEVAKVTKKLESARVRLARESQR